MIFFCAKLTENFMSDEVDGLCSRVSIVGGR
jgi:hypothetical protein